MSLKAFNKRQGRIAHDLALYGLLVSTQSTIGDDEYVAGWDTGKSNIQKILMRSIFNSSVGGNTINVKNKAFTLFYNGLSYRFPAGVVSRLDMGCFPYSTSITVDGVGNQLPQIFTNVGRIDHSTFGDKQ